MKKQNRWAQATLAGAAVGTMLLPVGALGSRFGVWPFTVGFLMVAVGVALAALALLAGLIALVRAGRQGRRSDYPALAVGIVLSLLVLGGIGGQLAAARSVPAIHNVSTDLVDPPSFRTIAALRDGANPHVYDASQRVGGLGTLGEIQQTAYPEVTPLVTTIDVAAAVDRAVRVLEEMGLEIVDVDATNGIVEATATTFWFGFKDDVVVRVRPADGGARVDVHSVSRVGQSDLGENAGRIVSFLERFAGG